MINEAVITKRLVSKGLRRKSDLSRVSAGKNRGYVSRSQTGDKITAITINSKLLYKYIDRSTVY